MQWRLTVLIGLAIALAVAAAAAAQDPATSFDALAGRIRVGQRIFVTDTSGREVHGRLEKVSSDRLILNAHGLLSFGEADVRRVRARDRDSLKNGTLIGLGIGGGMAATWCISAIADDSPRVDAPVECAEGVIVFPALGALIGLISDAAIPGKLRDVYLAAPRRGSGPTLTVAPFLMTRARGLAVSFAF